jgi:Flp pilus assembly protein TadD
MRTLLIPLILVAFSGCVQWDTLSFQQASRAPAPQRSRDAQFHSSAERRDKVEDGQLAFARLLEQRDQPDRAEHCYHALIEKNDRDPVPYHRLGVIAARQRRFAEAEQHFQTAKQLAPPTAKLLCDMGYAYYLQDKLTEAEEVLEQALELDPNLQAASNNLGLVLGVQGRDDESLSAFKRGVSDAEALANLAYARSQRGELEAAQTGYLYALTLDNTLQTAAKALLQVTQRIQMQDALIAAREQRPSQVEDVSTMPRLPAIAEPPATQSAQEVQLVQYEEAPKASAGDVHFAASNSLAHADVVPQQSSTSRQDVGRPTDLSARAPVPAAARLAQLSVPKGLQPNPDESQAPMLPPPSNQQITPSASANAPNSQLVSQTDKPADYVGKVSKPAENSKHATQGFTDPRPAWNTADQYPMARTTWSGIAALQAAARSRPLAVGTTNRGQGTAVGGSDVRALGD